MRRLLFCGFLWLGLSFDLTAYAQVVEPDAVTTGLSESSSDDGILVSENGRPVLYYQSKPKSQNGTHKRANYIHPLYDLDGNVLTEDFPTDHLHHRGVFWAWHQITCDGKSAGDGWMTNDFESVVTSRQARPTKQGNLQISAAVQWQSPLVTNNRGRPLPLINETLMIEVHRATENRRVIDFEIQLMALQPNVRIGGSDDVKGYGGFSVRVKQPEDIAFQTSGGWAKSEQAQMNCGNWVDIVGALGDAKKPTGLAILVHPSTAGFPQKWILRSKARSMQNPVFPGRQTISVSQTEPIVLRYRLVLHRQLLDVCELNAIYAEYSGDDSKRLPTPGE